MHAPSLTPLAHQVFHRPTVQRWNQCLQLGPLAWRHFGLTACANKVLCERPPLSKRDVREPPVGDLDQLLRAAVAQLLVHNEAVHGPELPCAELLQHPRHHLALLLRDLSDSQGP
eukprot:UN3871